MAATNSPEIVTGILVDEVTEMTIDDVARFCSVRREKIVELVSEGIVPAGGRGPEEWRFSGSTLARAGKAIRLEIDLEINLAAVALILDLLDEIEDLRRERGRS
ncbi:MAG: chaperone modulator CbpM [Pseudomonadota bacterium]|nr:chaperone modulator CbpM [Pseudomonadota bacterium]